MESKRHRNYVAVIFLVSLFGPINCELRFCHKGPQKVDEKECPYGIFFKQPITAKCLFYAPETASSQAPTYSADACSSDKMSVAPKTKLESTLVQKLEFGEAAPEDENAPHTPFDPINDPSCIQECFDTVDPWDMYKSDEEMPEYNFQGTACSLEAMEQQLNISETLFDYLLFGQDAEAKLPNNRIHQLLELCGLILLKHCGDPYVKSAFLLQSLEALKYMHFTINKAKILEVSAKAYTSIAERLVQCLESPKAKLKVSGLKCATKAKIETIEYTPMGGEPRRLKYRIEPKSYRFGKFDLFIEAAYAALDFAHSFCFEEFRDFPYELDMLTDHVARIFSIKEIEERWYCPVDLKNPSFWNNLAGVGDVKWTMRNIDFCAQAAAKTSVFSYRLDRTFESESDTHDAVLLGPPVDKMGWTGTEAAYWKEYDKAGGVKNLLQASDSGFCPTNPRDLAIFKEQQGLNC